MNVCVFVCTSLNVVRTCLCVCVCVCGGGGAYEEAMMMRFIT